jgi:hypothetical protein
LNATVFSSFHVNEVEIIAGAIAGASLYKDFAS